MTLDELLPSTEEEEKTGPVKAWTADLLTDVAVSWLRCKLPDSLIVPEFVCGYGGDARVDLAAITPDGIIGVEIKGEGDTHARLASQGPAFIAVCSSVYFLYAPTLAKSMAKHRPKFWMPLHLDDALNFRGDIAFEGSSYVNHGLCPRQMLATLWRPELVALARSLSIAAEKRESVVVIAERVADLATLRGIRRGVCAALLAREWVSFAPKGQPRRLFRPVGAFPLTED